MCLPLIILCSVTASDTESHMKNITKPMISNIKQLLIIISKTMFNKPHVVGNLTHDKINS